MLSIDIAPPQLPHIRFPFLWSALRIIFIILLASVQWISFFACFVQITCHYGHTPYAHMLCGVAYALTIALSWIFRNDGFSIKTFLLYAIPMELFFLSDHSWFHTSWQLILFELGSLWICLIGYLREQLAPSARKGVRFSLSSIGFRFILIVVIQVLGSLCSRYYIPYNIYDFENHPYSRIYARPKLLLEIPNTAIKIVYNDRAQAEQVASLIPQSLELLKNCPFYIDELPINILLLPIYRYTPRRSVAAKGLFFPETQDIALCLDESHFLSLSPNAMYQYARTIAHEMTHWLVHVQLKAAPPAWKNEGYAEYISKRSKYPSHELLFNCLLLNTWDYSEYKLEHPCQLPPKNISVDNPHDKKLSTLDYRAALLQAIYFIEAKGMSHEDFLLQDFPPASIDDLLEWLDPNDTLGLYLDEEPLEGETRACEHSLTQPN